MTETAHPPRPIRSYVLRQGRMTPRQGAALSQLWSRYGVSEGTLTNWDTLFDRVVPRILEIGFGMGDHLVDLAIQHPDQDFIGIEVHPPGVGSCLAKAQTANLTNLKIFREDAVTVLQNVVPQNSLDKVLLLFPDPWPKTRHHKRRLVQSHFVNLVAEKLKPQGQLHMATDWQPYADHMLAVLEASPVLKNAVGPAQFATDHGRLQTKFERRGQKLGHAIWDLIYYRT